MYNPVRICFEKRGNLKFISHLDLNRTMQRAIIRSKIPVWYTEGFNPHPFMTFLLPLSLGIESDCEYFDIKCDDNMTHDEIKSCLNNVLPIGLHITDVFFPIMKAKEITFAGYEIVLIDTDLQRINEFFSQDRMAVIKRTKSGEKEIDIKPYISNLEITENENKIKISLVLPAGNVENINPHLILNAMGDLPFSLVGILRNSVFNKNMENFK